jgi:hypothetical protein
VNGRYSIGTNMVTDRTELLMVVVGAIIGCLFLGIGSAWILGRQRVARNLPPAGWSGKRFELLHRGSVGVVVAVGIAMISGGAFVLVLSAIHAFTK